MAKDDAYGKKTLPKWHPKHGKWNIAGKATVELNKKKG